MSEKFNWNDFSAGWCPSDDPLNGRVNSLLKMENVELDLNGAMQMSGGTTRLLGSAFTDTLHTIYQKYINGTSYIYSGDTTGKIFRGVTSIKTGGSTTRAAFNAAYNYVFGFSGDKRFRDDGSTTVDLGVIKPSVAPTVATNGAGVLSGDYEYCQINVFANGTYRAKSARSAIGTVTAAANKISVTPQDPSVPSSIGNEAWIFRRGVNLDVWYRVARVTSYSAFDDNMSDSDALALGITMNDFLLSMNSTDTTDAIISCVGPIYGRMIYFTAKTVICSDIHSPDSYDSRTPMGLGGSSGSEIFKWAIKTAKNSVLIGTDKDVYLLSGTFVQLPDGFLDVSLDPLGVADPPIGIDVALYQNSAVYMSKNGWVACSTSGQTVNLCFPNTDLVYKGIQTMECGATIIDLTGATRYSCAITRNKLFCVVPVGPPLGSSTSTIHTEVYDFLRKYWHVRYVDVSPKMFFAAEDGSVIGFDNTDKYIKTYDAVSRRLDDGSSTRQYVSITSKFLDFGEPHVRKDLNTLIISGGTSSGLNGITSGISLEGHQAAVNLADYPFTAFKFNDTGTGYFQSQYIYDIRSVALITNVLPCKQLQFKLYGQPTDLRFKGLFITYDKRPEQTTFLRIPNLNLDGVHKKRVRTIPFILDTLGWDVTFTPYVDGVAGTTTVFNTTRKQVCVHKFTTDVFATDFLGTFQSADQHPFEFYGLLNPDVTYVQPGPKTYETVGEFEIFRYGKLKSIELRVATTSVTSLPYAIYCDGVSVYSGTLTISDDLEKCITISLPKTIAGSLLRIDYGPVSAGTFRHISTRVQAVQSGHQTEEKWIPVFPTEK